MSSSKTNSLCLEDVALHRYLDVTFVPPTEQERSLSSSEVAAIALALFNATETRSVGSVWAQTARVDGLRSGESTQVSAASTANLDERFA